MEVPQPQFRDAFLVLRKSPAEDWIVASDRGRNAVQRGGMAGSRASHDHETFGPRPLLEVDKMRC